VSAIHNTDATIATAAVPQCDSITTIVTLKVVSRTYNSELDLMVAKQFY